MSTLPSLWRPWEPPIPASTFLTKLAEVMLCSIGFKCVAQVDTCLRAHTYVQARRLCNTSQAEYDKILSLEKQYPSELGDRHSGRRLMGLNTLESVVLRQLGQ